MEQKQLLPDAHPDTQLIRQVGEQIVGALPQRGEQIRGCWKHMACCKWEFVVISDTTINAFVIPGGKVVVSTGAVSASDKFQCIDAFESADVVKGFRCVRELQMKVITLSGRFIYHWLLQQRRWKQDSHCGCLLVHVNAWL
jgi:hypothetical protein